MKINFRDILFWIIVVMVIAVVIWKLFGSPSDIATIIGISLFIISSEILLWKAVFTMDKKTQMGFIKIKHEIEKNNIKLNSFETKFNSFETKLNSFETKLNSFETKLNNIENKIDKSINTSVSILKKPKKEK